MSYRKIVDVVNHIWSQFTRSERVLICIIVVIIVGMTCIILNPGNSVGGSRNERRLADVIAIARAVHNYTKDNKNNSFLAIGESETEICASDTTHCEGLVSLQLLTQNPRYLSIIPRDPQCPARCHSNGTGYMISEDNKGLVTVSAQLSEQNKLITATF